MQKPQNIAFQEESDFKRIFEIVTRNYKFFVISLIITLILAFLVNHFMIPTYKISSSILIKEKSKPTSGSNVNEYLNSSLFGINQNFQNELWVLKSSPVIGQTISNLNLMITY
jgi:tyrosine-protein kinase Etk/Wzc